MTFKCNLMFLCIENSNKRDALLFKCEPIKMMLSTRCAGRKRVKCSLINQEYKLNN